MSKILALTVCIVFSSICSVAAQQSNSQGKLHTLNPTSTTVAWGYYWSEAKPVLTINSGDRVQVHTLLTSSPRRLERMGVEPSDVEDELRDVYDNVPDKDKGPGGHILTGPIYIEGAEPGDVLEVQIISISLAISYAYNGIGGNGFLSDEISERGSKLIQLDEAKGVAYFSEGIEIPLRPFFGSMGVAPPVDAGRINSAPPWIHAGNMDNKELVAGTTLFIPVHIKGALFEIGDGHAAQGNGEVDITAIETSLKGELRFIVRKDMTLSWPRAETPTHIITMGMDENLTEATKIAVREMIDYLMTEKNLSQVEAYQLTSVAVDLNITQLVDGKKGVHAMLPKSIFVAK